ncbi:hypothetical protein KCP74_03155 [Salmonella enterica subsp. enterica]|nr:hypothetical protein KCP74_03155 [Salmonella enterica subsp. enterica]
MGCEDTAGNKANSAIVRFTHRYRINRHWSFPALWKDDAGVTEGDKLIISHAVLYFRCLML